jgi:hypothetical protein
VAKKKGRTPAPPKRPRPAAQKTDGRATATKTDGRGNASARVVQAPQVRSKKRTAADLERRNKLILYGAAAAGILGLAIVLAVVLFGRGSSTNTSAAHDDGPNVNFAALQGLQRTPPPWGTNTAQLRERLKPLGLNPLGAEGQVLHIHQHLDIFVNGKHVKVPRFIGIKLKPGPQLDFLTELHTHNPDGVIHLESLQAHAYSLGQFFGVWGVPLSRQCIGSLCAKPGTPLKFYVNGKPFTGNPVRLVLQEHDQYTIVYGKPPAHIPSSFNWPVGE